MRRFVIIFAALILAVSGLDSCQKAPFLAVNGPRSYTFTDQGGSQSFSFSCNRDWSISSSESWVRVSPSSGIAEKGEITVIITCEPNTTYDARETTITLVAEGLIETNSVSQVANYGLLVSSALFELSEKDQTISVEVKANSDYDVLIDASVDWITKTETKALSSSIVSFHVNENYSYDERKAVVTMKLKNSQIKETITICQAAMPVILIDNPTYELLGEGGLIQIPLRTNLSEVSVNIPTEESSWIKHTQTKGLSDKIVMLLVSPNNHYLRRTGTIQIVGESCPPGSVVINQEALLSPPEGAVDLGLDVLWGTCNLGASSPEEIGDYYAWGETSPKPLNQYSWGYYKWCEGWNDNFTKYNFDEKRGIVDNLSRLEPEDDAATVSLGGRWRIPTTSDWRQLLSKCDWEAVENYEDSGIDGIIIRGRDKFASNFIFFPRGGFVASYGSVVMKGSSLFWSSDLVSKSSGNYPSYAVNVYLESKLIHSFERNAGLNIRPVLE